PRLLMDFIVRGRAGNQQSEVLMQALPKRIVVKTQSDTMTVGSIQPVQATAFDINDQPIATAQLKWRLSNAGNNWDLNNPMAEIDASGRLHSMVAGQLRVTAYVDYGFSPWLIPEFGGEAFVLMQAPRT